MRIRGPLLLLLVIAAVALLSTAGQLLGLYTDWRWFREVQFTSVFVTVLRQVSPNEIVTEKPYIDFNIHYTRLAYGLDNIEELEFPAEQTLTLQDLQKNDATLNNIRLWDTRPLLATYSHLQEIRTYYKFTDEVKTLLDAADAAYTRASDELRRLGELLQQLRKTDTR
jgi:uncharacterized membrane protein (UPF0182 family)